jgi:hypothetical protein
VQFPKVPGWDGVPFVVGQLFVLTKGNRTARCVVQTHPLGLEVRLSAGRELFQSQVCRGQDDVSNTSERWRTALQGKGWR